MQSKRRQLFSVAISVVLLALVVTAWLEQQQIYDMWRLHNYQASSQIAELATQTTMNPATRRIFYVQHPVIDKKATFNADCKTTEQTIVLGCYIRYRGVYVLSVQDPRLDGVEQVTAAHELLHAEYDLLSPGDKKYVDGLILQTYSQVTDPRIKQTIAEYQKQGADTTNELHSILGTEVRNLPPALENYYRRYFTNREQIVSYSEKYEQVFTNTKNQVTQDDAHLAVLKSTIATEETNLKTQSQALDTRRKQLNSLATSGQVDAYNAAVPGFNAAVEAYNAQVADLKQNIDQFNQLVASRNSIALEEQNLVQEINSNAVPTTK